MNMFRILFSNLTYKKCLNAVQERAAFYLNENDSNAIALSIVTDWASKNLLWTVKPI